mgnify:CR=1 FL=1
MVNRLLHFSIFLMLFMPITSTYALNFTASVDTHKPRAGNSFQLILKADEQAFNRQPNLAPLKQDFEILRESQSNQVRLIDGQITSESQWKLTLLPKSEGYLVIPPITYGNKKTKAITIKVAKARKRASTNNSQLVFLEATTDKTEVYVQEQTIFYLRVYKRAQLADASLAPPEVENAVIESLGEPRIYTTQVQGNAYNVTEYPFAIYPQKSGKLTIPSSVLSGAIAANSRRFMFDPFGNAGKPIRRKSKAIEITVKAIPTSYPKNVPWIPARNLSLTEQWAPVNPEFKVGEPATRSVTLTATGVAASLLPPLPQPSGDNVKIYPDQPTYGSAPGPDGIQSERTESYAVIPTKGGVVTLPKINVHWWNTVTDTMEIASIEQQAIQVAGTQLKHQTDSSLNNPPPTNNNADVAPPSVANMTNDTNPTWIWIAAIAALLWVITSIALIFALKRKKPSTNTEIIKPESPFSSSKLRESHRNFVQACKAKEPRRTEKQLAIWASQLLKDRSIRSSSAILQHIDNKELAQAIHNLQAVLYRGQPIGEWDNEQLLNATNAVEKATQENQQPSALADLHPSVG